MVELAMAPEEMKKYPRRELNAGSNEEFYSVTAKLTVTVEGSLIELTLELADPAWDEASRELQSPPSRTCPPLTAAQAKST